MDSCQNEERFGVAVGAPLESVCGRGGIGIITDGEAGRLRGGCGRLGMEAGDALRSHALRRLAAVPHSEQEKEKDED